MKPLFETNTERYTWVNFYTEFAIKLLGYRNDRQSLIRKVKMVFDNIGMKLPTLEKDNNVTDIDPFTIFGTFNKGITYENRVLIINSYANEFGTLSKIPDNFDGIPVLNNMSATFYRFINEREDDDIENIWNIFEAALAYANTHSVDNKKHFIDSYNKVLNQKGIKWNLTMALYWISPYEYINLDSRNRWFICEHENMPVEYIEQIGKLTSVPSGEDYLKIVEASRTILENGDYRYKNFIELSYYAWLVSEQVNQEIKSSEVKTRQNIGHAIGDKGIDTVHYWLYSPGSNACKWEEFYNKGIMGIGWGEIGELDVFTSKEEIKEKMKECYDPTLSYRNDALAVWQFSKEMKQGDIVFVKKGMNMIVGKGVIESDYEFDDQVTDTYNNIRNVKWTHKGEWKHPGQAAMKTLTDITQYTDYVKKLNMLFDDETTENAEEKEIIYDSYSKEDFLNEVYISSDKYDTLAKTLKRKKNIILQGAPGVGKTFAAKRLAYSIMGVRDKERVKMIQFHQSYSYEDFIMGFRPVENGGFELHKGVFYEFCKKAEADDENDYFFIIDEINRGNLSKIFGELFMLIESDKRGIELDLLYSNEKFSIPEKMHIIGMMNTADRSLAMLDYALRRRFTFFEFEPAFDNEQFREYQKLKNNTKFNNLISCVKELNDKISEDESLGKGFRIGHSYFCTEETITDEWLSSVVEFEIIPLLNEYWFDEPAKIDEWSQKLGKCIENDSY